MSEDVEIEFPLMVKDTLINTYIMVMGHSPSAGSYEPDEDTCAALSEMFGGNSRRIRQYCSDAMLAHLWMSRKGEGATEFWADTRLVHPNTIAYLKEHRTFLRERFGSLLGSPDSYHNEVYAGVFTTESEYLAIFAECFFRDMPFEWDLLTPTLHWYVLNCAGVKEMPSRRAQKEDIPESWANEKVRLDGVMVPLGAAVSQERTKLKKKELRLIYVQAAERALYDAARQWCERYRLMKLYLNAEKRVAIAKQHSKMFEDDIAISYPLINRDRAMFAKAKGILEDEGEEFEPLPSYAADSEDEEDAPDTRYTGVIQRGSGMEAAIKAAARSADL